MFESVVAAILNKFLGPYIKNLDSSQLKLSIFSGDVALKDLEVKPDALADKNLPIRVHAGYLRQLTLKIPWRSLYTEPTVVVVDGVYLLVGPTAGFKYDAETAEKEAKERKQKHLEQIEEKRRIEREGKPEEKSDGFVEKMVTQIIKNVQVTVQNVHVRYEDNVTHPGAPFAIGVTLEELSARTADSNWKAAIIKEAVQQIHKVLKLQSLAAYMDTNARCLAGLPLAKWLKEFNDGIVREGKDLPDGYHYVLRPFSGIAKLMLNKKAGTDMNVPKMLLEVMLEQLGFTLSRPQFLDVMQLVESFDRTTLNAKFIKYKATGRPKDNPKGWWKYCISAVLNENVRRRLRMWSWKHIKKHRRFFKDYRDIYQAKLLDKQYPKKRLEELEDYLDVYTINLARGVAEAKVGTEKLRKKKEKKEKGWFGGWFGGKTDKKGTTKTTIAGETVEISAAEKAKLYEAIDYVEDASIAQLPNEYIDNKIKVQLRQLSAGLIDDKESEIIHAALNAIEAKVETRTAAKAVRVAASTSELIVTGVPDDGERPVLLKPQPLTRVDTVAPLFEASFEQNPPDGQCDQRVRVELQPAEITADMLTVNAIVPFFSLPEDVKLQKLQSAATDQLNSLKEQGRAVVQHAIGKRKLVDINVQLHSSYVLLPETGRRTLMSDLVVVDLGALSLKSELQDKLPSLEDATQRELDEHAFDRFKITLTDVQVMLASREDDWQRERKGGSGRLHLLQPVSLDVVFMKSVVPDDIRLPKVKLSGELPLLQLTVSERKIKRLIELIKSLPLPESPPAPPSLVEAVKKQDDYELPTLAALGMSASALDLISLSSITTEASEMADLDLDVEASVEETIQTGHLGGRKSRPQALKFAADLTVQKVGVLVSRWQEDQEKQLLDVSIMGISTAVKVQTWDIAVDAGVQKVAIQDTSLEGNPLNLLQGGSDDDKLVSVCFLKANSDAPNFEQDYGGILHKLTADVSTLKFVVQDHSLLQLKEFSLGLVPGSDQLDAGEEVVADAIEVVEIVVEKEVRELEATISKAKTQFQLEANLREVGVVLCTPESNIATASVKGLTTTVAIERDVTTVQASLSDVVVLDSRETKYHKILSIEEGHDTLLKAEVSVFKDGAKGERYADLDHVDVDLMMKGAALRVVFLNGFVRKMVDFGEKFKPSDDTIARARKSVSDMAEAAKTSMKENRGARIRMDIELDGPVVIVPRNELSDERLEANLGTLVVSNRFKYAKHLLEARNLPTDDISDNPDFPAVIDCMKIELQQLNLTRFSASHSHSLISPMNFEVLLQRSLSDSYRGLPLIDVTGNLPAVELKVGKADIDFTMAFLNENMKEGEKSQPSTEPDAVLPSRSKSRSLPPSQKDAKLKLPSEDVDFDWTKVKASFHLPKVSLSLLEQSSHSEQKLRLVMSLSALNASVRIKGPCLEVSTVIGDAVIVDYAVKTANGDPLHILYSEHGVDLLDFKLRKADPSSQLFKTEFEGIENKITTKIAAVDVVVHRQSVLSLTEFALSLKPETDSAVHAKTTAQPAAVTVSAAEEPDEPKPASSAVQVFLQASLKKIGVTLKSKEANLASVGIAAAEARVHLDANGALTTTLTVDTFHIDDIREKQHGITKLIGKYSDSDSPMLDVTYKKTLSNEHIVIGSLNELNVALCMDFLLSLVNFAESALPTQANAKDKKKNILDKPPEDAHKKRPLEIEPGQTAKPPLLANVKIKMGAVHVFLLEDSFDRNTRALYLTTTASIGFKQTEERQTVFASLPQLALLSCIYSEKEEPRAEIISPFDLELTYNVNLDENKKTASVQMSSIHVSVDPYTVNMLKTVGETASSALKRLRKEEEDEDDIVLAPPDLFQAKDIDSDRWYYDTTDVIVPPSPIAVAPGDAGKKRTSSTTSSMIDRHRAAHDSMRRRQESRLDVIILEELTVDIEKFQLRLENEFKGFFYPLLSADGTMRGTVTNWSKEMRATAFLELEISYYNERLAVWEPLLEPVPRFDNEFTYQRWQLKVDVKKSIPRQSDEEALAAQFDVSAGVRTEMDSDVDEPDSSTVDTNREGTSTRGRRLSLAEIDIPEALLSVDISSQHVLQLTITKTTLQVFTALAEDWSYAESAKGQLASRRDVPPYDIHNQTGLDVKVWPGPSFKDCSGSDYRLASGQTWCLSFLHDNRGNVDILSETFNADQIGRIRGGDCVVSVEVTGFKVIEKIPVLKAAILRYALQPVDRTVKGLQGLSLVCEIEALEGQKIIRLRSPVQVKSLLPVPVELQMVLADASQQQNTSVLELKPEATYYPPLLNAASCVFMLRPLESSFSLTETFTWKDRKRALLAKTGDGTTFCVRLVVTEDKYESIVPQGLSLSGTPHHTLHLCPPLVVHNLLPVQFTYAVEDSDALGLIEGGQKTTMFHVDLTRKPLLNIMATDRGDHDWVGSLRIDTDSEELSFFPVKTKTRTGKDASLQLGVQTTTDMSVQMYVFCPYWMVNKTWLPLQYKPEGVNHIIEHEPSSTGAVMLAFDKTSGSKRKAQLRISDSQWSKPFSLDIAGSGGVVKCMLQNKEYELGVKVNLTSFRLSRIVTFTPYQVISNNSPHTIYCFEGPSIHPLAVDPGQCAPLWPEGKSGEMQVAVGSADAERSQPFKFTEASSTLLQLNGKVVALNVEVQVSDSSIVIAFTQFFNGAAPVRIENNCTDTRANALFWQKSEENSSPPFSVDPETSRIFTWPNPTGNRTLMWSFGVPDSAIYENTLNQDNHGKIELTVPTGPDRSPVKIYWASFLDGLQRVLIFTNDKAVAEKATETEHVERPDLQLSLSLQGVGIALVNNFRGITAAYIGISSSGSLWEFKLPKKKRWKPESYDMGQKLERIYQDRSKAEELKLKVDFSDHQNLRLIAPKEKDLRRTLHEGIYFQFTMSRHHFHIHAVVNRVQIDNQVLESVFPTVFHPVKPPKSVAAQAAPKPFLEGSVVVHRVQQSNVRQIKYLMVLIQEISVQVDMGFITNVVQVFAPDRWDDKREVEGYKRDEERVNKSLSESSAVMAAAKGQKMFIDFLHLSPIKVHISFSMDNPGSGDDGSSAVAPVEFIATLLKSIGVVLTDVQDVELRLSYFELTSRSMTEKQLLTSIRKHYTAQALKQVYALILGLDVLGNPFGLVNKVKDGVFDLFYEPYQGAVQGPEEFAIGVAFGVRSLVSHTVGGLFGAVSRITGTVGKGIAKLTFDDKYQRDLATSKDPKNVGEGLVKGTKGFLGGILHGVTGVVTKPFEGAKSSGVKGFFKGVGKGVIGLVARPVGGVFELASSTFQGISNTADLDAEVVRLRCPRFIDPSKVVHPYNLHNATGNFFLQLIDTGKFSQTDVYFAHSGILEKPKIVVIVTNKHVILMEEGGISFIDKGELKSPWSSELKGILQVQEYQSRDGPAIQFVLKSFKKTFFASKSQEHEMKAFKAPNKAAREYVIHKVKAAIDRFCPPSHK